MKKPTLRNFAKFGTAAAILCVAGVAFATGPITLTASYAGQNPVSIDFKGCRVGDGDTIETYLSTDSGCVFRSLINSQTAGKYCNFGQYSGSYVLGCSDTGDHFWLCSYDVNQGDWSATVDLGVVSGCIG